jgi:hypothetical protein
MTPRDRRALLSGLGIVVMAVVGLRLGPAVVSAVGNNRQDLASRAELLARMRADVRDATTLQDSADVVQKRVAALAGQLLGRGTEAQVSTSLEALISMAAEHSRVRVGSTEAVPDSTTAGAARRVSVRALVDSDTGGLLNFLLALAQESPALTVSDLQVAADLPAIPSAAEVLHSQVIVRGWYLPPAEHRR